MSCDEKITSIIRFNPRFLYFSLLKLPLRNQLNWTKVIFILILCQIGNAVSQTDSTLILETLNKSDLENPERVEKVSEVYAASRMPEDPSELPGKVYIIYQEEILENGFSTLVDVLKSIPGIRTSQPGTAELGETFIMRGLLGNSKTRILINGSPVRPFSQDGMDIGAQLPIRQADRIEIVLGPAASLYGSDAIAGVINIVIDETDRPMETMVNISGNSGTMTESHVALGGKLFRDKNVLKFNFFANFRSIADYNLNTKDIRVDTAALSTPFYVGEEDDLTVPEIRQLSHNSELIGTRLDFKDFTYNFQTLYRKESSGIGSHPQLVDFTDVGSYYANRSFHHALSFNKTIKRFFTTNSNFSALWYKVDPNSSYKGTSHPVSNGKNFMFAKSRDFLFEQLFSYNRDNLKLLLGGTAFFTSGIAQINYLRNPWNPEKQDTINGELYYRTSYDSQYSYIDSLNRVPYFNKKNYSAFGQLFYRIGQFNFIAAARIEFLQEFNTLINPKFGVVYSPLKSIKIRSSYSTASQEASPYILSNHYFLAVNTPGQYPGLQQIGYLSEPLTPVQLKNFELGVSYESKSGFLFDLNYFRHVINNNLFPRAQFPERNGSGDYIPGIYEIGYYNLDAESLLNGIEFYVKYENSSWRIDFGADYYFGHEEIDDLKDLDQYRSVPDYILKSNLRYKFKDNIFTLNSSVFGQFIENVVLVKNDFIKNDVSGYYNIDLSYTRILAKQFYLYIKVTNLTNAEIKGINTNWLTAYPYEYIPQLNRQFMLGLTYNLR